MRVASGQVRVLDLRALDGKVPTGDSPSVFNWLSSHAAAVALFAATASVAPAMAAGCRDTPSGLPVPRYVSLKFGEVNARVGPGDDYPLLWTYHARGLPLMVVAETQDWRRVRDPQGGLAWVKGTGVSSRRTALRAKAAPLALRHKPEPDSPISAFLAGRSLAELKKCKDGWCKLKASGKTGWAPQAELWGADDLPQCR